ncbi:hypothetical protein J7E73_32585 [Paenibacillus albidus]|uniref:hypothetical protein n=1 Tax=Paenibacillus albidus TaxID=2041023 RepID=UPI001BEC3935|nr:hypothetical protein [Paenibacillus albidus]MBT2293750.1 hypothetical protein [Paenibacillus albidus]
MNNKTDIVGVLVSEHFGLDFTDQYMRKASVYVYVFEQNKQCYVWQTNNKPSAELTEGNTYHLTAVLGNRLLGGRGILLSEVTLIGEMKIV